MIENEESENNENNQSGIDYTLYLLLIISSILLLVDLIELYRVILNWQYGLQLSPYQFETCIRWDLYTKTTFSVFSILGAISSFSLVACLLIDQNIFTEKILTSFLYFNYLIFGPYMLGFCIIGISNWNNVVKTCDRQNYKNMVFSPGNMLSLIGCFVLSLMVTFMVVSYNTTIVYMDSIRKRPGGSNILRKLFWWCVFKNREPVEFIRITQGDNNNNNRNENNIRPNEDANLGLEVVEEENNEV